MDVVLPPIVLLAIFCVAQLVLAVRAFTLLRPDRDMVVTAWVTGALSALLTALWIVGGRLVAIDDGGHRTYITGIVLGVFASAVIAVTLVRLARLNNRYHGRTTDGAESR